MKSFLIFAAVIVVAAMLVGYLYFYKELPQQEDVSIKSYANIFAYEKDSLVKTGYRIFVGSRELKNGTTNSMAGIRESIPINRSVSIETYNLEDQDFYTSTFDIKFNEKENHLITLDLVTAGKFKISKFENISKDKFVSVLIDSDGEIKNPAFCFKTSSGFLVINAVSDLFYPIQVERFPFYDKCYSLSQTFLKETEIELEYLLYGDRNEEQIEFIFFDGDRVNGRISYSEETGGQDLNFILK